MLGLGYMLGRPFNIILSDRPSSEAFVVSACVLAAIGWPPDSPVSLLACCFLRVHSYAQMPTPLFSPCISSESGLHGPDQWESMLE